MKRKSDVLIIGAGVVGICSAYYLSQKGYKVVLVEKGDVCSGSSYGNAGLIVPSHSVPLAEPGVISRGIRWMLKPESPFHLKVRFDRDLILWLWKFRRSCNDTHVQRSMPIIRDLSVESLRLFAELALQKELDFGYEQRGTLYLCKTEKGLQKATDEARLVREMGMEVEILNPTEAQVLEPNLRLNVLGGVFYPRNAHLRPYQFVRSLAGYVEKRGVEIKTSTEVLSIQSSGRMITEVRTTRGNFSPGEVLLAAGAWSPEIARDLKLKVPIQPAKGYSITYKRPQYGPTIPLMLAEAKVASTPLGDTLRFAGTLELAGMDLSVNRRRIEAITRTIPTYLPDLDPSRFQLVEIWRGLRSCTPDGLPLIGRARMYDNLTIAAGHSTIGMTQGPVSGKLVSCIISNEDPGFDLSQFSLERFG